PDASMRMSARSRGSCTAPFIAPSLRHAIRPLRRRHPRTGGSDEDKQTSLSVLIVVRWARGKRTDPNRSALPSREPASRAASAAADIETRLDRAATAPPGGRGPGPHPDPDTKEHGLPIDIVKPPKRHTLAPAKQRILDTAD